MTATVLDFDTDTTNETEEGTLTHIIRVFKGENPFVVIMEARLNGTPVTALCGYVFVPEKNPNNYPICEACKEIHELEKLMDPSVNEPEAA